MITQFVGLERKTSRAGRDTIDHAPGSHDDLANSAAGAVVMAAAVKFFEPKIVPPIFVSVESSNFGAPFLGSDDPAVRAYNDRRHSGFSRRG